MKKIVVVLMLLLVVFTLSACSKGYTDISNEELQGFLDGSQEMQFVDVRTSAEYLEKHAVGFTYNIDYYLLEQDDSLLDQLDKTVPVVLMCRTGNRSASAAVIFVNQGFEVVYNLENGIDQWTGQTE